MFFFKFFEEGIYGEAKLGNFWGFRIKIVYIFDIFFGGHKLVRNLWRLLILFIQFF